MSHPRSSRIVITLALAGALVTAGLVASPVVEPSAEASVGAAHAAPRSVTDDTVLGTFAAMGSGVPANGEVYAIAVQGDDTVYAGGNFTLASGVPGTARIASWSNADDTWHAMGGGTTSDVNALAVQGGDTVYTGGYFTSAGGVSGTRKLAAWSIGDDTWRSLGGGVSSGDFVYALAVQGDDTAYAGGDLNTLGGVPGTSGIAAWSTVDDTWRSLGGGTTGDVNALAVQGDDTVYAGGGFNTLGGVTGTSRIAAWSTVDDTWRSLGGGATSGGTVYALAIQGDDTVYAGGDFSTLGGVPGTSRIAAWSNVDDTWHPIGAGIGTGEVNSLAVDNARGLIYAGGTFVTVGSVDTKSVAVLDAGIRAWIPLQADGGVGVTPSGRNVYAMALMGSSVYLGGNFTTAGGLPTSSIAKWTWGAPTAEAVPASGAHGTTIQVRGSRLIGVAGVRVNGSPATYTRDDSTTVSVVIPGSLYDGTYSIQVDAVGGTATTSYTVTGSPAPQPVYPPSEPRDVKALAGNASADVTWSAPASAGSYPVTHYQAVASPGNAQCLVDASAKSCTIRGLSNGTTYTVTVRALNGAGWSAASAASNPVTPSAAGEPTILITGSRSGPMVSVKGTSTGLGIGAILKPWVRFAGQGSATQGAADILVDTQGSFTWQRRTAKTVHVYVATPDGSAQSNTVVIPVR